MIFFNISYFVYSLVELGPSTFSNTFTVYGSLWLLGASNFSKTLVVLGCLTDVPVLFSEGSNFF